MQFLSLRFDKLKVATLVFPNLSKNVLNMRTKQYLIKQEMQKPVQTIEGVEMKKEVKDIIKIANRQRKRLLLM
jgi:hypothetical protein